jgi:hypothetical protein
MPLFKPEDMKQKLKQLINRRCSLPNSETDKISPPALYLDGMMRVT